MIEVAWAAVKKKGSYFKDKSYRLKARRGAKKAMICEDRYSVLVNCC
jgi:hypothetical protein